MSNLSEDEELYQEELNEYAGIEQTLLEDGFYSPDLCIILNVPLELKLLLEKINNIEFANDIMEYGLRNCSNMIYLKDKYYKMSMKDKLKFFVNKYPSSIKDTLVTYMDILANGIENLVISYIKGLTKIKTNDNTNHLYEHIFYMDVNRHYDGKLNTLELEIYMDIGI